MRTIRVGSRESRLAVVQSGLVMEAIRRLHPGVRVELVTMKTTGDAILDRTLDKIGGKGLFTRELERALLGREIDICVHSYKDLPVPDNPELPVVAVTRREDPRDVLILPEGRAGVEFEKPVGTSSLRRRLQLGALYPEWESLPVRGNVLSRLLKLDAGEFGGLVLAAAGIRRLGLWGRVHRVFSPAEMIPAPCQGMLAVQGLAGGDFTFLDGICDRDALDESTAERAFISELNAGCSSPVAVFAVAAGEGLTLSGLHVGPSGRAVRGEISGPRSEARRLGVSLAAELKAKGGDDGR